MQEFDLVVIGAGPGGYLSLAECQPARPQPRVRAAWIRGGHSG